MLPTTRRHAIAVAIAAALVAPPASAQGTEGDRQREILRQNLLSQIDSMMRMPMAPRIAAANGSTIGYPRSADLTDPDSIGAMVLGGQLDGYALVRMGEFDGQAVPVDWPRPMRVLFPKTPRGPTRWYLVRGTGRAVGTTKTEIMGQSISVPLIEIKPAMAFNCEQDYCAEYVDKQSLTALIERRFGKGAQ